MLIGNNLTASYSNSFHNMAVSDGGAIYSENQNKPTFNNCELNFNRAGSNGGAICLKFQSQLHMRGDNRLIVGGGYKIGG